MRTTAAAAASTTDVIHTYSRADALRDGALTDVTLTAREAGLRLPTAISVGVLELVTCDADALGGQSTAGRLWDVLWMARCAAAGARGASCVRYQVIFAPRTSEERRRTCSLVLRIGPGDDAAPVLTICLPGEE